MSPKLFIATMMSGRWEPTPHVGNLGKYEARVPIRLLSEGTQFTDRFFSFGFEETLRQIAF
ncbi:MAG: hypothetical protein DMG76_05380 [Acidobacteria bacterium]|nr:MAG: hypothetical protein DMG76_05380 [Acidobacteriota bacterium]